MSEQQIPLVDWAQGLRQLSSKFFDHINSCSKEASPVTKFRNQSKKCHEQYPQKSCRKGIHFVSIHYSKRAPVKRFCCKNRFWKIRSQKCTTHSSRRNANDIINPPKVCECLMYIPKQAFFTGVKVFFRREPSEDDEDMVNRLDVQF
jgi:hypothetical protein